MLHKKVTSRENRSHSQRKGQTGAVRGKDDRKRLKKRSITRASTQAPRKSVGVKEIWRTKGAASHQNRTRKTGQGSSRKGTGLSSSRRRGPSRERAAKNEFVKERYDVERLSLTHRGGGGKPCPCRERASRIGVSKSRKKVESLLRAKSRKLERSAAKGNTEKTENDGSKGGVLENQRKKRRMGRAPR